MKDDLISREAFDEVLKNAQCECKKNGGNFRVGVLSTVRANLANQPSVPAVPLDKLCEWLEYAASYNSCSRRIRADQWKYVLKEWMEEQDAAD